MEKSPSWDGNRTLGSPEISHILWKSKIHYRIYKSPSPVSILSQINPVYVLSLFLMIHFNIILPSTAGSSRCYLFLRFPRQKPCMLLSSVSYVPLAPPISFFSIWSPEWYLVSSTDHKAPYYIAFYTPLLPCPSYAHIFLSTPLTKTLSLCSSLNVRDQFHTHRKQPTKV